MAARITHLEILRQVLVLLEHGDERQNRLSGLLGNGAWNRFAALGAVAPDLFYFYHLYSKKKNGLARLWGNLSHHTGVTELILNFLDQIRKEEEESTRNKLLAFAMGYISHCAVDVITHPYIFYYAGDLYSRDADRAEKAQLNHLRIEYALDSYLLYQRWGLDSHHYNLLQYLDCRDYSNRNGRGDLDHEIWSLWVTGLRTVFPEEFERDYHGSVEEIAAGDIINESYIGFMRFNSLIDARSSVTRVALKALDFISLHRIRTSILIPPPFNRIDPRIPNEKHDLWKYPAAPEITSNDSFIDLVHRAAKASRRIMIDALDYLHDELKARNFLERYQGYNLDTGLRSSSTRMVAFQPLEEVE